MPIFTFTTDIEVSEDRFNEILEKMKTPYEVSNNYDSFGICDIVFSTKESRDEFVKLSNL